MKKPLQTKRQILAALACLLAAAFLWNMQVRKEQQELAARISPSILRFHVIANSNGKEDQELKLKVKSFLLEEIYRQISQESGNQELGKEQLCTWLSLRKEQLAQETESFLHESGKEMKVSAELKTVEFPEKFYGSLRLPAGSYDAFQVTLGQGRGRNWWCVLYPKLCLTKDAVQETPESSLETLKVLQSPEDYQAVTRPRPNLHIRFAFLKAFHSN